MTLPSQYLPIGISGGIDTFSDPKTVQPPKLLALDNARLVSKDTVQKRYGYTGKGTVFGVGVAAQKLIDANGEALAVCGPGEVSAYQALLNYDSGQNTWVQRGGANPSFLRCNVSYSDVTSSANFQYSVDVATTSDGAYTIFGWEEGTPTAKCCIVDRNSGVQVVPPTTLIAGHNCHIPRVIAAGTTLLIGFYDFTSTLLRFYYYSPGTGAMVAGGTSANIDTSNQWDWCVIGSTIYVTSYKAGTIYLQKMTTAGVLGASTSFAATSNTCLTAGVASSSSTTVRLFWYDNANGVKGAFFNASTLAALGAGVYTIDASTTTAAIKIAAAEKTSGTYHLFVNRLTPVPSTDPSAQFIAYYVGTDAVASPAIKATQRAQELLSKPYVQSQGDVFFVAAYGGSNNPTCFLFEVYNGASTYIWPAACFMASQFGGADNSRNTLSNLSPIGSSGALSAAVRKQQQLVSSGSGTFYALTNVVEAVFSFPASVGSWSDKLTSAYAGGGMVHVGGGFNGFYDGLSIVENGFFLYPEMHPGDFVVSNAGGSMLPGTYEYVIVYEWRDNKGNIHESETSVPVQVVVPAGTSTNKVTITIPTLRATLKSSTSIFPRSDVTIVIYRTENAQQIFYRLVASSSCPVNDTTADTVSFIDTYADTAISVNQQLYTTGGVVDNVVLEGTSAIAASDSRIFAADPYDPGIIHYTKKRVNGYALSFSAELNISLPAAGGPVTAIAIIDDKVIAFKASGIFYTQGDGFDDTATNGGYPPMRKLTTDVGCIGPQLLCEIPAGIFFRSQKGFYLLGRDLSWTYVGSDVQGYNGSVVLSVSSVPLQNQVRCLLDDASTQLVYDHRFNAWCTHSGIVANDARTIGGVHMFVVSAAVLFGVGKSLVYYEDSTTFYDALRTLWVEMTITLPWIAAAGLQGYQRARRVLFLGANETAHTLECDVSFDFVDSIVETHTATSANITVNGTSYNGEIVLARQKCIAVKLSFFDPSPSGESYRLTNLTLEFASKGGAKNAPQKSF
jgi:hypothetical protein